MAGVIEVEPRRTLALRLTPRIAALMLTRAYRAPLETPSCEPDDPEGLVSRTFHYKGKGRDVNITVTCHAKVMVGLMRAMRKCPSIQVTQSSSNPYSGSYRSYAQQMALWTAYKDGTGHRAAHPCSGYHRQGRALDLYQVTDDERSAMLSVRVDGIPFYDGLSFGDPPHFCLGAKG